MESSQQVESRPIISKKIRDKGLFKYLLLAHVMCNFYIVDPLGAKGNGERELVPTYLVLG